MSTNTPIHATSDEIKQIKAQKKQMERVVACAQDGQQEHCEFVLIDPESGIQVKVPRSLMQILAQATDVLAEGGAVAILPYHSKLTTQEAADYLGVSRPYFISLLDEGVIPYERLRSHRRILLKDLEAYRRQRDTERRTALAEMTRESYRLGLYDIPDDSDDAAVDSGD